MRWTGIAHLTEVALIAGAYLGYMLIRGLIAADIQSVAFHHAERVVAWEKNLGIFWEPALQRWTIDTSEGLIVFFNWAYILSFYPVIITAWVIL